MHRDRRGLSPKGTGLTRTMHFDEPGLHLDMGLTLDNSRENAVIGHQLDSNYYRSAGISTTPHFERAKYYPTRGFTNSGIVYRIARSVLHRYGAQEYVVSAYTPTPKCPDDDEVILVYQEPGPLPSAIVIEVIPVDP